MGEATVQNQYPTTAYALSLVAGILMMVSGAVTTFLAYSWAPFWGGMMGGRMMGFGPTWMFGGISLLGLASGAVVVISAILLRSRPKEYNTWGILILIFSILSFFGMGGFFIGAIIGIVGGALALSWKPTG
ncbi:MAG: hypothetical protein HY619_08065 [Thaumarchaeota archaeon]|nr:hypothetical protein [Nitrososphaerota archaeon]